MGLTRFADDRALCRYPFPRALTGTRVDGVYHLFGLCALQVLLEYGHERPLILEPGIKLRGLKIWLELTDGTEADRT